MTKSAKDAPLKDIDSDFIGCCGDGTEERHEVCPHVKIYLNQKIDEAKWRHKLEGRKQEYLKTLRRKKQGKGITNEYLRTRKYYFDKREAELSSEREPKSSPTQPT